MADIVFHRTELAEQMVKGIMASAVGSASASGLFLAAPRRTGKSTFVREDLRPALQRYGATVLYVDLWANKQADPGAVIVGAVRAELAKHEGIVARLAKAAGMEKVTVGGVAFSLDRVGLGKEISLSGALAALSDETKQPIVLLIDEAQHAITTDGGYDACSH
jgi:sugar phosphate isomerase/epimerase